MPFFKGPTAILGDATIKECWFQSRPNQPSMPIHNIYTLASALVPVSVSSSVSASLYSHRRSRRNARATGNRSERIGHQDARGPGVPTVLTHGTCAREGPSNDAWAVTVEIGDHRRCSLLAAVCVISFHLRSRLSSSHTCALQYCRESQCCQQGPSARPFG